MKVTVRKTAEERSNSGLDFLDAHSNVRQCIGVIDVRENHLPLVYLSKILEHMTGYSRSEILGKSYNSFFNRHGDNPDAWQVYEAIGERRAVVTEVECRRRNGETFTCRISVRPLNDSQGNPTHFIFIHEDISHVKVIEETLASYVQSMH